ncbi:MAG: hypothetical protein Q8R92_21075 [Deltaproteobacteria bacterium]|nr:hypothetical protein [Deltaproteobacteria bacterium]
MSFARSYDAEQALAALAAVPGTVVIRQTPQSAFLGAGYGCVCVVGEVGNDQFGDPNKTLVNTPRQITSDDQISSDYGGLSDYIGSAADGWEGNIAKALALPGLEFTKLALVTPQLSAGQVTFTRPNPGKATVTPGNGAPWRFDSGDTLGLSVDGGLVDVATFDAARAARQGAGLAIVDLAGDTLQVAIDGGPTQTITFEAPGDLAAVVSEVNAQLEGGYAYGNGGELVIASDTYGTGSSVEIIGGTALAELGHAVGTTSGSGDTVNIRAVTAAEFKAVVEADIAGVTVDGATGALSTDTEGDGGSIQVDAGSSTVEGATKLNVSTAEVTGGSGAAAATSVPAGTRVRRGSSGAVYLTLEDLSFPAGSSGTSLQQSVRVRPLNDSTIASNAGAVTVIVDTLNDATFTVTNAAPLTPPDFDAAYATAIAATLANTGISADIDIILARRHTAGVHTVLRANALSAASGRRGRVALLSPPVGTANATAAGSSGVGVGVSRGRYYGYAYPAFRTVLSDDPATKIDMPADLALAHLCSVMRPEENVGADRSRLIYVLGLESGLDVTPSQAQYQAWLEAGIAPLQISQGAAEFLNDPTTELVETAWNELNEVRMALFLTSSLHDIGARWAKKLRSDSNKRGLLLDLEGFFDTLNPAGNPELQRIAGYSIDDESGNTPVTLAAGLHIVKIAVQTLPHMNTIVYQLLAGKTVKVTAAAAAAG